MENNDLIQLMQSRELNMLLEIKKLFDKHDIFFSLACGTALGGIRHKGFIPWDDDVDIYVRAEDYGKIRKIFSEEDTGKLILHDFETIDNYPYTFPKIVLKDTVLIEKSLEHINYQCGIYIDIFLLGELPRSVIRRMVREIKRYFYYSIIRLYYCEFSSKIRKILGFVVKKIFNPNKIQYKLYRLYTEKFKNSQQCVDIGTFGKQAYMNLKWFEKRRYIKFENYDMPVMNEYEEYLNHYYGDYKKLPPQNERKSNHNFSKLIL